MKPVTFKPQGRRIAEFRWSGDTRVRDPIAQTDVGPHAVVVVRYVEETATVNGRVDDTTVYAEGESVRAVRDECFAQLAALHAVEWRERLWVRFEPGAAFGYKKASGLSATRVRTAATTFGPVWQRWGKYDTRTGGEFKEKWFPTRLGAPPVGLCESESDAAGSYYAVLCDPDPAVAAACAAIGTEVAGFIDQYARAFVALFEQGETGIATLVRRGTDTFSEVCLVPDAEPGPAPGAVAPC